MHEVVDSPSIWWKKFEQEVEPHLKEALWFAWCNDYMLHRPPDMTWCDASPNDVIRFLDPSSSRSGFWERSPQHVAHKAPHHWEPPFLAVRKLYLHLAEAGILIDPLWNEQVEVPNDCVPIDDGQWSRLNLSSSCEHWLDVHDQALMTLAFMGLRSQEIANLRVEHVSETHNAIEIADARGRPLRWIRMRGQNSPKIREWKTFRTNQRPDSRSNGIKWLFACEPAPDGSPFYDGPRWKKYDANRVELAVSGAINRRRNRRPVILYSSIRERAMQSMFLHELTPEEVAYVLDENLSKVDDARAAWRNRKGMINSRS